MSSQRFQPVWRFSASIALLIISFNQSSCRSLPGQSKATMRFPEILEGHSICETTIRTYPGVPIARLSLKLTGRVKSDTRFDIHEQTTINGVPTENRTYRLMRSEHGEWLATAPCIVGEGVGTTSQNKIRWKYESWERLPNGRIINLKVAERWTAIAPDKIQINQVFFKYGIPLAFGKGTIIKSPVQGVSSTHSRLLIPGRLRPFKYDTGSRQ